MNGHQKKNGRSNEVELLEGRRLFAVTASFNPSAHVLTVIGDNNPNSIVVSRDAAGSILVNGGLVAIRGGTPTVVNTSTISIFGLGGTDTLALSEVNGTLPNSLMFGGAGNDVLTGGSGADQLFGMAGNDTLLGKGGADLLLGGSENDTLTGGTANDAIFGQSGDDRMIWNPGEDTDLNEGGEGTDTVEVNSGNGSEKFAVTPNGTRVRFDRIEPAPFSIDIGTSEKLVLNMNGGNDTFTGANGLAPLIQLTVDGGTGDDTITGGDGVDHLLGGDGKDTVNGGRGNDFVFLGADDDTFVWNPGDGSDTVEGQAGVDRMVFNGANANEGITMSANGGRLRFVRDLASVTMDTDDIETVDFNALGGTDNIVVNDLSGTDVTEINVNLAAIGGAGDGQADSLAVSATNGDDVVTVTGAAGVGSVFGLSALINFTGAEAANDVLIVNALSGDDVVDATLLPADAIRFTANGGAGDDVLLGGAGADTLNGNEGDDVLIGGAGNDVINGGTGDNVLIN